MLSRSLATANHFPAIDVLESISRLRNDISSEEELATAGLARDYLALYRKNEDIVNLGAYVRGTNPRIDAAIIANERVMEYLKQGYKDCVPREESYQTLAGLIR